MTREEAAKILYSEKSNAGWMRWVGFPVNPRKEQAYKEYLEAIDVALSFLIADDNPHIQTAPKPTSDAQTDSHARKGCPECNWIDPALAWTGEDKPVYCKRCGRRLEGGE